ncbi:MAG: transposase [Acidobacteriota bacterium]
MARSRRIKIKGEAAYYHIMSRTVGNEFLLNREEKEKFVEIIKRFSRLYFVKIIGYCVMSNHFHLLIRMDPSYQYKDEDVIRRLKEFYGKEDKLWNYKLNDYRKKLSDISEFTKIIKQNFSWWYNRVNDRRGYFWSDRFKSVLIERGESLLNCLAYIDLNPVRAGIVDIPEKYRWSSFGYRIQSGNSGGYLSFDGIYDDKEKEVIRIYRKYLYGEGVVEKSGTGRIKDQVYIEERDREFIVPPINLFRHRIRYFSEGLVLGSKDFIKTAYIEFGNTVILKKDRKVYNSGFSENIFSIRRLKEI